MALTDHYYYNGYNNGRETAGGNEANSTGSGSDRLANSLVRSGQLLRW
jgi:hypothetical protein